MFTSWDETALISNPVDSVGAAISANIRVGSGFHVDWAVLASQITELSLFMNPGLVSTVDTVERQANIIAFILN